MFLGYFATGLNRFNSQRSNTARPNLEKFRASKHVAGQKKQGSNGMPPKMFKIRATKKPAATQVSKKNWQAATRLL